MTTEPLQAQDATLWCAQSTDSPLQVGAVCLFERAPLLDDTGALRIHDLRQHLEGALRDSPRLRQRIATIPFGMGRPLWVDDDDFDIAHHVRSAALPHPGTERELRDFVSRLIEAPLDQSRPLWEFWFVDDVVGDRVAVVPKVSHVMADGMAILEFALSTLDLEPGGTAHVPQPWSPEQRPGPTRLLLDGLVGRTRRQWHAAWSFGRAAADPATVVGLAGAAFTRVLPGDGGPARSLPRLAPALRITRPVGRHRDVAWTSLPIGGLEAAKKAERTTLNDVVLAIVAGALGTYLARSPSPGPTVLPRALVPASTHGAVVAEEIENHFSFMIADLPIDLDDPLERLRQIHAEMVRHKASAGTSVAPHLFNLIDLVPEWLVQVAAPPILRRQPFVNLAVTNLPGTREPLYLLGSRMLELFPYVSVIGNLALIIGVISYGDVLCVGVTVDADVIPDVEQLTEDLRNAAHDLVVASTHHTSDAGGSA